MGGSLYWNKATCLGSSVINPSVTFGTVKSIYNKENEQ